MKIIDCDQYSDLWWEHRRGVPSASNFGRIITPAKAQLAKAADAYIYELIGDLFDAEYPRKDVVATAAMRRGTAMEPEARAFYEHHRDSYVRQVGFCTTNDGRFGCSPDALVGTNGVLELKAPMPATMVQYLDDGVLPDEYKAQVHGHLIVTGADWVDFLSYCPGLPPLLVRVEPDEFTKKLAACLESFWTRFCEIKAKIEKLNG